MKESVDRCWVAKGRGVYLAAIVIVFAPDSDTAIDSALQFFRSEGLHDNCRDDVTVREVPQTGAHMVFNGDY